MVQQLISIDRMDAIMSSVHSGRCPIQQCTVQHREGSFSVGGGCQWADLHDGRHDLEVVFFHSTVPAAITTARNVPMQASNPFVLAPGRT